jgi:hypothetical protein
MGANPSRRDAWPRPTRTRHVLVRTGRHTALPQQGLVVEWRLRGKVWWALVALLDVSYPDARLALRWLPGDDLVPVDWPDINAIVWNARR